MTIPDQDDQYVLAAEIKAVGPVVVTFNLKDFPSRLLAGHRIQAVNQDRAQHLPRLPPVGEERDL